MRKFIAVLIIYSLLIPTILVPVRGETSSDYTKEADILKGLGLFQGTESGYQLQDKATRAQGAVMLVRFLGMEDQAKSDFIARKISHPFTDVPEWADPHIAYLYTNGLAKGIKSSQYGSSQQLTGEQYMTMMLRMLGFDDEEGDFQWNQSLKFWSDTYKLSTTDYEALKESEKTSLSRGLMIRLSYISLKYNYKNSTVLVFEDLYQRQVFNEQVYRDYKEVIDLIEINDSDVNEPGENEPDKNEPDVYEITDFNERKGVWLSYLELGPILNHASETEYRSDLEAIFRRCKTDGFNTVYFQVRCNSEAIYPSEVYSWSYLINENYEKGPGYDPLALAIEIAHDVGLRLEAWINPYRIRTNAVYHPVEAYDKLQSLLTNEENVFKVGDLWTLNPASQPAKDLIIAGVKELLLHYDIDGIQYDDYFYPNQDMSLDKKQYESYLEKNTWISQSEFRRRQVISLVEETYKLIETSRPEISFGLSPQGSLDNNYNNVYLDVEELIKKRLVDYLLPQVYYGFDNQHSPYEEVIHQWEDLIVGTDIDLMIGLSAYKIGLEDKWAGGGSDEWIISEGILARMLKVARGLKNYRGVSLFRFDSIYHPKAGVEDQVAEELRALKESF